MLSTSSRLCYFCKTLYSRIIAYDMGSNCYSLHRTGKVAIINDWSKYSTMEKNGAEASCIGTLNKDVTRRLNFHDFVLAHIYLPGGGGTSWISVVALITTWSAIIVDEKRQQSNAEGKQTADRLLRTRNIFVPRSIQVTGVVHDFLAHS